MEMFKIQDTLGYLLCARGEALRKIREVGNNTDRTARWMQEWAAWGMEPDKFARPNDDPPEEDSEPQPVKRHIGWFELPKEPGDAIMLDLAFSSTKTMDISPISGSTLLSAIHSMFRCVCLVS